MHGRDYWFVSGEDFRRMAEAGELVEWAEVHGNLYGTPRRNLHDAELRGEYLLLDVDIQGARQLRERVPDAVMVFILPPAGKTLGDRLSARGSEDRCELERRLSNARGEIAAARDFDYVVLNDDLEATVDRVEEILAAEAHRVSRLSTLDAEIERLGGEIGRYLAVGGAEAGHTLREKDPCE
jgi:guanylate kinase